MVLFDGTSAIAVDDYDLTDADKHFLSAIQNPEIRQKVIEILLGD